MVVRGRLKPGVSEEAARAEVTTVWTGLVERYADANRNRTIGLRGELSEGSGKVAAHGRIGG